MRGFVHLRLRLRAAVVLLVVLAVVSACGGALAVVMRETDIAARKAAKFQFEQAVVGVSGQLSDLIGRLESQLRRLAQRGDLSQAVGEDGRDYPLYDIASASLAAMPDFYSAYAAQDDGGFWQLISVQDRQAVRDRHAAPARTQMIVRTIVVRDEDRLQTWIFLDEHGRELGRRQDGGGRFDPRRRPWHRSASAEDGVHVSDPYFFNSLKEPGLTASMRGAGGLVLGIDVALNRLQANVDALRVSDRGGLLVLDSQDRIMAASRIAGISGPMSNLFDHSGAPFDQIAATAPDVSRFVEDEQGREWAVSRTTIGGWSDGALQAAVFAPLQDFTGGLDEARSKIVTIGIGLALLGAVSAWLLARRIVQPVAHLAADADNIRRWRFNDAPAAASFITEINALSSGFALMKKSMLQMLEQNPVGIVVADADGRVEYANAAYLKAVGTDLDAAAGTIPDLIGGDDMPRSYPMLAAPDSSNPYVGELRNRRASGERYWEKIIVAPVRDEADCVVFYVALHEDCSVEHEAREKSERLTAHLLEINSELERFAYVASHDLREPLRSIAVFIQMLQRSLDGTLTPETREYMDFVVGGAQRMDALINDLLVYSRLSAASGAFVEVDAAQSCAAAVQNLDLAAAEADAEIVVGDLPKVIGNPVQVMQVFQNLIGNGLKFRSPDRRCRVEIGYDGIIDGRHHFYVADNGIGIESSDQDVFEVFRRLHAGARYPGTGIGLAVCRRVVRAHGGDIRHEAGNPCGTVFRFSLAAEPPPQPFSADADAPAFRRPAD